MYVSVELVCFCNKVDMAICEHGASIAWAFLMTAVFKVPWPGISELGSIESICQIEIRIIPRVSAPLPLLLLLLPLFSSSEVCQDKSTLSLSRHRRKSADKSSPKNLAALAFLSFSLEDEGEGEGKEERGRGRGIRYSTVQCSEER